MVAEAYASLAAMLYQQGQVAQAEGAYNTATQIEVRDDHQTRGLICRNTGSGAEAVVQGRAVVQQQQRSAAGGAVVQGVFMV